jgi:hypothetical protein
MNRIRARTFWSDEIEGQVSEGVWCDAQLGRQPAVSWKETEGGIGLTAIM